MNWGRAQVVAQIEKMRPDVVDTGILREGNTYVVVIYYRDGSVKTVS